MNGARAGHLSVDSGGTRDPAELSLVGMARVFRHVSMVALLALAVGCTDSQASHRAGGADSGGGGADGGGGAGGGIGDGAVPDGGSATLADIVKSGQPAIFQLPRPAYGAVVVANHGERSYVVESRRDVEPGPFGLPWRSRFRLAAYDAGVEAWAHTAQPDDLIGDVVVHPSGELTLSLQRHSPAKLAYDLVRLAPDGALIGVTTLSEPASVPESDYGAADPRPLFRMKSELADATTAGWLRLLADGEGVLAAFLSFVDVPDDHPLVNRMALGVAAFDWQANAYVERWARVVEGPSVAQPAAWAYDELRWREQAIRPFLARDDESGQISIGRAWNSSRCEANVGTFAEFESKDCIFDAVGVAENERLPLAVTHFDDNGARLGTVVLAPDADAAEQVPFALAARGGELAVAGSVVRTLPDGSKKSYSGFVDYDGYIAFYDPNGQPSSHADFNLGRGDVLASMRWTPDGVVAVGSSGWDRWSGGMSISRGADPSFVWLSPDKTHSETRVVPLSGGARHMNLHDVVVLDQAIVGYGFSDAPMTHSADGGKHAERTYGPLHIRLTPP